MKTAYEILINESIGYWKHQYYENATDEQLGELMPFLIKAMKLYANQKLDEAHSNLKQTAGQWNSDYNNERNKILSLKDQI